MPEFIFAYHICGGGFPRPLPGIFIFFGDTIPHGALLSTATKVPKSAASPTGLTPFACPLSFAIRGQGRPSKGDDLHWSLGQPLAAP